MLPPKGTSAASLLQELNAEHAPESASEETNVTTLQETNEGTIISRNAASKERANEREAASQKRVPKRASNSNDANSGDTNPGTGAASSSKRPQPALEREERLSHALGQASEDEIAVVTVRVSGRLNEYMDRYVERMNRLHPKRRYRKQDAVAEAFAAFYADHLMPPAPEQDDL